MEDHNADVKLVLAALKTDQDARPANEETELVARLVSRGQAQLAAIRQMAVAADTAEDARALRERILALDISDADEQPSQPPLPVFIDHGDRRVAWDCESVLCKLTTLARGERDADIGLSHIQQSFESSTPIEGPWRTTARQSNSY